MPWAAYSTSVEKTDLPDEELKYLQAVDEAIKKAGDIMDLADLDEDMDPSEADSIYEDRFHCGKCIVRTVMETIWPDLNALMEYYEKRQPTP